MTHIISLNTVNFPVRSNELLKTTRPTKNLILCKKKFTLLLFIMVTALSAHARFGLPTFVLSFCWDPFKIIAYLKVSVKSR